MNQVTHIIVSGDVNENTQQRSVLHFYNVNEVKSYIERNPNILDDSNAAFYKVDEIKPTRTVTIDVSL